MTIWGRGTKPSSPPPSLNNMKSSLGSLIQVTVWVITEIRITKDTQEMLVLLIYANVAFLQLNVNNLAWATTGDTITMQSQVQKFTLFSQLIRQSLRETERDRDTEAETERQETERIMLLVKLYLKSNCHSLPFLHKLKSQDASGGTVLSPSAKEAEAGGLNSRTAWVSQ